MSYKGRIRYVFTSSNTGQGFQTFIPQLVERLRKVYILKGAAGTGKTTFIKLLGESICEQGYEVEYWISALNPVNPDGLYIPQLEAAVVNGSLPQPIDPRYPGGGGEIINLGDYLDRKKLDGKMQEIREVVLRVENEQSNAYNILRTAARVEDEITGLTLGYIDMERVKQIVDCLGEEFLDRQPREKHYFARTITADGILDYVDELSSDCRKRYIFEGPRGSGGLVLEELARKVREGDHYLEYYHCGLNGDRVCMLIIRNLQMALIDGAYTKVVKKPWDIIIDTSSCLEGYDSDSVTLKSSEAERRFESLLLEAQNLLDSALLSLKELKKINAASMDFGLVDQKMEQIKEELAGQ
ncbi:MAG: hypothetical protein ABFD08_05315 [Syntrophomonas sp.]